LWLPVVEGIVAPSDQKESEMGREPQEWGGEVRLPIWLRKILRRPADPTDTPGAAHEARKARATDDAALKHMQAAGTLAPHHSELAGGKHERRR
jgi:hypothetical protein